MADDYKEKLKNFIADIPAYPGQIVAGEPHKPPYDDDFKKKLADPTFTLATNELFHKYTGAEHLDLIKNWAGGGQRTTCNEFVGKCSAAMGAKDFLGQFELEALLQKVGKGHAWVPATSGGPKPGYGDIFRPTHFHMGVSLGFRGDTWLTVESGQGGPNSTGADIIKRKEQYYDPSYLLGWCDMRAYLDPRPALPDWLVGTWVIYCGNKTYTYNINKYYEATTYLWKPVGDTNNVIPTDTGTVSLQGSDAINITWTMEGGTEKFNYDRWDSFPGIMEKMSGASNKGEPLKGIRV
jgi:hypothetical protein